MTEHRVPYLVAQSNLLQTSDKPDTIGIGPPEAITVSRVELETEHNHLLARIHQLRRLLGYPVLLTGKQARRQHE